MTASIQPISNNSARRIQPRQGQVGFTLVEMMIVIAIIGILAALAAPSIDTALKKQRNKQTAETVIAALREARTESLLRRQDIVVVPTSTDLALRLSTDRGHVIRRYTIHANAPIVVNPIGNITFGSNKVVRFTNTSTTQTTITAYCNSAKSVAGLTVTVDRNGNISSGGSTC